MDDITAKTSDSTCRLQMQMSGSCKVEMSAFRHSAGMAGPLTLSMKELDRLHVLTRIAERRLTRRRAA